MDMRDLRRNSGYLDTQQLQFAGILFAERFQDTGDHVTQQSHHGKVVLDKAKFNIQAHILIDVARGVVWLGTKDRTDLEDALEDSHHDLLVKLRTLRQVCGPPKVVQFEDIAPPLAPPSNNPPPPTLLNPLPTHSP